MSLPDFVTKQTIEPVVLYTTPTGREGIMRMLPSDVFISLFEGKISICLDIDIRKAVPNFEDMKMVEIVNIGLHNLSVVKPEK